MPGPGVDWIWRRLPRTPTATVLVAVTMLRLAGGGGELRADANRPRWQLFAPVSTPAADTQPHPAVVRVAVEEGRVRTNGSGTLVAVRDQHGLVVTNWHVIRDAQGPIEVLFPGGFRSEATVLKTDQDWDLAALLIWRPDVAPLPISSAAPQPGESLTIAGYGQGDYRALTGKCTQYVAPSMKHPYEIVEVSAEARQGDSGGPILNSQNELAGVLFGSSRGSTSGSYCGRVRWFLSAVWPELEQVSAQAPAHAQPLAALPPQQPWDAHEVSNQRSPPAAPATPLAPLAPIDPSDPSGVRVREPARDAAGEGQGGSTALDPGFPEPPIYSSLPPLSAPAASSPWSWAVVVGTTRFEQAKTLFAALGLLAVWGHLSRRLS